MKKIVIITFESYVKEAHLYCLETLDYIASNGAIIEVEIIDYHAKKTEPLEDLEQDMKINGDLLQMLINFGKHIEQIHNDLSRSGVPVRCQMDMISELVDEIAKTGKIPFEMMRLASIKKRIQKTPPEFCD